MLVYQRVCNLFFFGHMLVKSPSLLLKGLVFAALVHYAESEPRQVTKQLQMGPGTEGNVIAEVQFSTG